MRKLVVRTLHGAVVNTASLESPSDPAKPRLQDVKLFRLILIERILRDRRQRGRGLDAVQRLDGREEVLQPVRIGRGLKNVFIVLGDVDALLLRLVPDLPHAGALEGVLFLLRALLLGSVEASDGDVERDLVGVVRPVPLELVAGVVMASCAPPHVRPLAAGAGDEVLPKDVIDADGLGRDLRRCRRRLLRPFVFLSATLVDVGLIHEPAGSATREKIILNDGFDLALGVVGVGTVG